MNKYTKIADYYDELMQAGYYDYEALGDTLSEILKPCKSVLELGVGSGLIAEKLLQRLPDIDFMGIDFTSPFLEQANERLGDQVCLEEQNVVDMKLEKHFDAAFSNGGVWYFIDNNDGDYVFCSHLPNLEDNQKGLKNVENHLKDSGKLVFSVQGVHRDY